MGPRGVAGGLGRLSKGRGGWGLEGAEGLGSGGWTLGGPDGRSLVRSDGRKFPPVFYRTSSPSGPLPKKGLTVARSLCPSVTSSVGRSEGNAFIKNVGFLEQK